MEKRVDSLVWTGSRRWLKIDFRKPFFIEDMIVAGLEAKGVQRCDGSHYKNSN